MSPACVSIPRTKVVQRFVASLPIATTPLASCAAMACAVAYVYRLADRAPIVRGRSVASRPSPAIHSRLGRSRWGRTAAGRRTTRRAPAFRLLLPPARARKGVPTSLGREPAAALPIPAAITRAPARARPSRVAGGTAPFWVLAAGASIVAATTTSPRIVPGSLGVLGTPPVPGAAGPCMHAPRTPARRPAGTSRDARGHRSAEGRAAGLSTPVALTPRRPLATRSRAAHGRPQPLLGAAGPCMHVPRT